MSPSEIEEILDFEPFIPLRLTLASGDTVELHRRAGVGVTGLSLSVQDSGLSGQARLRLVSIPNIVLVEPIADGGGQRAKEKKGGAE